MAPGPFGAKIPPGGGGGGGGGGAPEEGVGAGGGAGGVGTEEVEGTDADEDWGLPGLMGVSLTSSVTEVNFALRLALGGINNEGSDDPLVAPEGYTFVVPLNLGGRGNSDMSWKFHRLALEVVTGERADRDTGSGVCWCGSSISGTCPSDIDRGGANIGTPLPPGGPGGGPRVGGGPGGPGGGPLLTGGPELIGGGPGGPGGGPRVAGGVGPGFDGGGLD